MGGERGPRDIRLAENNLSSGRMVYALAAKKERGGGTSTKY